mmetsp:Transcript_9052/g.11192  ORF Transcript_9052/g.11192 Transcript_9052/m.11192 type:complete len:96 (+) Transcript_9052:19-306(+)
MAAMEKAKTMSVVEVRKDHDVEKELQASRASSTTRVDRRNTLYYNASNYDSLAKQLCGYQVVLLGTEYVESKKMGAKPYTVCIHFLQVSMLTHCL